MTVRKLIPIAALSLAGCFPGRICMTPPYDAPAGFSESYHDAIQNHETLGVVSGVPLGGTIVGPPIFAWPTSVNDVEPPIEW